jgi:hypothetical protein
MRGDVRLMGERREARGVQYLLLMAEKIPLQPTRAFDANKKWSIRTNREDSKVSFEILMFLCAALYGISLNISCVM